MKTNLLTLLLLVFCPNLLFAQKQAIVMDDSHGSVNIASDKVYKAFIHAPGEFNQLKSANSKKCQILVDFIDFPAEAKEAFLYAASIWETQISSDVPIRILAKWEACDQSFLAKSRAALQYRNLNCLPEKDVYYAVALAEKLGGVELNQKQPDIICTFNSKYSWYYGTDGNTPTTKYDLVTAALHEITHGLGFTGFLHDENGKATFKNNHQLPSIYDFYIFNKNNQQLANKDLFARPSVSLYKQLISEELKINAPSAITKSASDENWIYAPSTWKNGVSIYHLNETFNSEEGLMSAYAIKGKAIHNPGKKTMNILSELGWKSVSVFPTELKDIEGKPENMDIAIEVKADMEIHNEITFVFSKDLFKTCDSIILTYNAITNKYEGKVPVNYHQGSLKYFYKIQTKDEKVYTCPARAPENVRVMNIGDDYYLPELKHNPQQLLTLNKKTIDLTAVATDNIGVKQVTVEYKIDGIIQESHVFNQLDDTTFNTVVQFPSYVNESSKIEYRIIAEDSSIEGYKRSLPKEGYYTVEVFRTEDAVDEYSADFNNLTSDFVKSGFSVSTQNGFENGILHTKHPYNNSMLVNEKVNMIAQLKKPVRIKQNGIMRFDEIVLVEPGDATSDYNENFLWDYVIVEASIDDGISWMAITERYDASADEEWEAEFNDSINETSMANGTQEMFRTRTINLTENTGLIEGDEVIFRFRLAADNSVNGWGWAIDNLQIQKQVAESFTEEMITAEGEIVVYPNPCANHVFVDCTDVRDISSLEIVVTDIMGKTTHNEIWADASFNPRKQIDVSNFEPGFYLVNVINNSSAVVTTQKIVKN